MILQNPKLNYWFSKYATPIRAKDPDLANISLSDIY
jgi:hypothetical protein